MVSSYNSYRQWGCLPAEPGVGILQCNPSLTLLSQDLIPDEGIVRCPLVTHVVHQDTRNCQNVSRLFEQVGRNSRRCRRIS